MRIPPKIKMFLIYNLFWMDLIEELRRDLVNKKRECAVTHTPLS
jgi:hypothetical protein